MNIFDKWWRETGSGITPIISNDCEEDTKRVCEQFYKDVISTYVNKMKTTYISDRNRLKDTIKELSDYIENSKTIL